MSAVLELQFNQEDMNAALEQLTSEELDELTFGVIGIDREGMVCRYNALESKMAGLSLGQVMGLPLFTVVAPCMNNFLVAQRFEDARYARASLDATIDYVLSLRMRPAKVKLRLLAALNHATRYVLVKRLT